MWRLTHGRCGGTAGLAAAGQPVALLAALEDVFGDLSDIVGLGFLVAAMIAPVLRFRQTPPWLERQPLKWAASGFAGSLFPFLLTL